MAKPLLIIRGWTRQPAGLAQIDWSNPITRDLRFAATPCAPFNVVDGIRLVQVGSNTLWGIGARPVGLTVISGTRGYPAPSSSSSHEAALFDTGVVTALCVAQQDVAENNNFAFARGNGSANPSWGVGLHGGSNNGAFAKIGNYTYNPSTSGKSTLQPRVTLLRGDGANAEVYLDLELVASSAYTPQTNEYDINNGRQVWFGSLSPISSAQNQIRPALGLMWGRYLSTAETLSIIRNPWQVFRRRSAVFFKSSGATIYRPGSDIAVSGWVGTPGSPLYANIDEAAPADADYITSPSISASPNAAVFGLTNAPLAAGTYQVSVRASVASGTANLRVRLYDNGGTEVGASALQAVTTTLSTYAMNVTTTGSAYRGGVEFTT